MSNHDPLEPSAESPASPSEPSLFERPATPSVFEPPSFESSRSEFVPVAQRPNAVKSPNKALQGLGSVLGFAGLAAMVALFVFRNHPLLLSLYNFGAWPMLGAVGVAVLGGLISLFAGNAGDTLSGLWREWVRPIGEAVIIAVVLTTFAFTTVAIDGASDEPNIHHGERVFVPKYETWLARFGWWKFHRGDLVVLKPPKDSANSDRPMPIIGDYFPQARYRPFFIKRIVGEPGDRIKLVNGQLYVNGIKVNESHTTAFWRSVKGSDGQPLWDNTSGLSSSKEWSFKGIKFNANGEYEVPKGKFFVMGDNRSLGGSEDSRYFGPIALEEFAGRATFVWWAPFAQMFEVKAVPGINADGKTWQIYKHEKLNEDIFKGTPQVRFNMRPLGTPEGFVELEQKLKDQVKAP